jgi:polysaccharide chain length determinant protein (PEP-CTERM system associated)
MPLYPNMEPQEFLELFRRRKWMIVFLVLFIMLGASVYSVVVPELYRSSTTIMVISQQVPEAFVRPTVTSRIEERLASIQQQVQSRTRLMRVMHEFGLYQQDGGDPSEAAVEAMRNRVGIRVRRNETFTISFVHEDPHMAQAVASRLASFFIDENLKTREQQAVGTSEFLETQLQETKAKLEIQEEKVKQYKMLFLGELPQQLQANLNMLTNYQSQLQSNAEAIRSAEDRKAHLESQITSQQRALTARITEGGQIVTDTMESLLIDLSRRRAELAELTTRYTDRYPEVIRLRREVARLEKEIEDLVEKGPQVEEMNPGLAAKIRAARQHRFAETGEIRRLRGQIETLDLQLASLNREGEEIRGNIARLQARVEQAPAREQEMIALTRDYENLRRSYDDLLKKKLESDIAQDLEKRQQGEQFLVLDPANLPEKPFQPNRPMIFLYALIASCVLGFGGVVGLEMLDPTIRGKKEFTHFFDVGVLACIPIIRDKNYVRRQAMRRAAILGGIVLFTAVLMFFLATYEEKIRAILGISWGIS